MSGNCSFGIEGATLGVGDLALKEESESKSESECEDKPWHMHDWGNQPQTASGAWGSGGQHA